jgi:methionine-rich copper-binding protein CopC
MSVYLLALTQASSTTLDFSNIDGTLGEQTLSPIDVWNSGSKVVTSFGGIAGLSATVTSSSSNAEWNNQPDFHYGASNTLWLSAADNQTTTVTFTFSHPISGSISSLTAFGDVSVPEKLVVSATGSSAVLTDNSTKSTTSGLALTYLSENNDSGGSSVTNLLTYTNVTSLTFTYTCDYAFTASSACGSLLNDWVIAPTLSSSTPSDDATGVALASNITLTFSENVVADVGDITISNGSSDTRTIPVGDAQVSISGATVTINPSTDLLPSTSYYVQIDSGAIDDAAGNPFAGITDTTTLNFDTGSISAPPSSLSATVGSGEVTVTFSAPADSGSSAISEYQYQLGDGSWVSTSSTSTSINITGLTNGTTYNVKVRAVTSIGEGLASSTLSVTPVDFDSDLTASATITEPAGIGTTIDTAGEAVDLFDFTISDGGGGDGLATTISQIVVNVSGTASDTIRDQITWRLDGPDVSNVTGTYNASNDTITFTGLSISIADGSSETYTINGYFNDNTNVTEDQTIILSVDGDTDLTVGASGTQFAATTAVNNSTGTTIDVVATTLGVTTQPAGSVSGSALTTQPVVTAQDGFGNTDVDFTETITLTEASAGTLSGDVDIAAVSGVATFTDVAYTATADQQSFTLTADDESGVGSDLTAVSANAITSDVVATTLAFSTQPIPLTIEHGTATSFTTVPVVVAQDANGVTDTGYATDITIAEVNGAGSATFSVTGDTDSSPNTASITPSSGAATFTGLSITYSASGSSSETLNLQASSGSLTTATSSQLTSSDTTAPTVSSVSVPADGTYGAGQTLSFTVNTTEAITVTGTPQIALTIGGATEQATYASGSGSTALVFSYTVQAGDVDADGIAVASSIAASGGTLKDGAGNDLILTLNSVGSTSAVLVEATAPTVSILNAPSIVNSTSAFSVTFEFSENVTGFAVGDITVTNGTASNFVAVDGNTYTADITPDAGGNVAIDVLANVAQDAAGNYNTAATQASVTYDATAPTVSSVSVPSDGTYIAGQTLSLTVNTSEAVTVDTTSGTPQIAITIGSTVRQAVYASGSTTASLVFIPRLLQNPKILVSDDPEAI